MTRVLDRSVQRNQKRLDKLAQGRMQLETLDDAELLVAGLKPAQIEQRQLLGMNNKQHNDSSRSNWAILRANLFTLFNLLVGFCFVLLVALGQFKDALFGLVVILNITIGIIQEYRSKRALDKLALLHAPNARVRRSGDSIEIKMDELLLDDLIELRAGDQVLADAKVLVSNSLEADESMLTGESEPVAKIQNDELLAGSGIAGGNALARVMRIGSETYASQITLEARRFSMVASELRNALARLVKWISFSLPPIVILIVNGQMMAHGGWSEAIASGEWLDALVRSVAAIISMIPQGLVLMTSIAFAVSAMKLTRRNVLVQELAAVEGLARVDVVCFDKTGTLTEGEIEFIETIPLTTEHGTAVTPVLSQFAHDPAANATARSLRNSYRDDALKVESAIEFNSARKFSALRFEPFGFNQPEPRTWVLGAPEMVLIAGGDSQQFALGEAAGIASTGRRTLVLACSNKALDGDNLPAELEPVALVVFGEQVRSDAADTLRYFAEQQVSVRVISGDNPATVAAVARAAGLDVADSGFDARDLPEELPELAEILENNLVFGRVTPQQKRNMVLALQSRGHVVAMTGDGVNDALALKKADMGIAMGSGAAATKAVSNLVLLDGKFSNLPSVVAEGRRVIANIERVSRLFLTKTVWAMVLSIVFGAMLWQFPFLPRQLSVVDAFTIGVPAFALALLPNPRRYLPGFLKRALSFCVPAGLIVGIATTLQSAVMLNVFNQSSSKAAEVWSASQGQTATSIVLSIAGIWVLVCLARPLNGIKIAVVATMAAVGILAFTVPAVVSFFGFEFLQPDKLVTPLVFGASCVLLIEIVHRIVAKITK